MLEKTLESPLDCMQTQPVHSNGDQSWVFIGGPDVEAKSPVLWPPDVRYWLIWKDPDAGKDWGWEEKGTTEDEMVGWYHRPHGHEFVWTLGVGEGQGGLACCGSWGCKELDTTEWLNWTELNSLYKLNKQGDNMQPWHTPFPFWCQSVSSMSGSNCFFLTCIQISHEAGKDIALYMDIQFFQHTIYCKEYPFNIEWPWT